MQFNIITIFPELVADALKWGVVGQSVQHGGLKVNLVNPRQFSEGVHQSIDDRPYGGGDGMVFMAEPLRLAVESLGANTGRRVFLSAHGEKWTDRMAREYAAALVSTETSVSQAITLICGRYGGVDRRFLNQCVDQEISIGDYVLSGGELAALVMIDSMARFLPGVLGNEMSHAAESFSDGLLEAPQFTRPQEFGGEKVPKVALSGDHRKIAAFRRALQLATTMQRRPDLIRDEHRKEWQKRRQELKNMSAEELMVCGLSPDMVKQIFL